jgi:hypothetical protein
MERKDNLGKCGGELKSEFDLGHAMFQILVSQPKLQSYL